MNTKLKIILALAIGATAGSITTNLIMKRRYEAIVQEEMDSIRETFGNPVELKNPAYVPSEGDVNLSHEIHKADMASYHKVANSYKPSLEEALEAADLPRGITYETGEHPYVITEAAFSTEMIEYDKITINYYGEDGIFLDENDDIIPNPDEILGDPHRYFGETAPDTEDPNVVYVRNESLGIDYEVVNNDSSFHAVMGGTEDGQG